MLFCPSITAAGSATDARSVLRKIGALAAHVAVCDAVEFGMDDRGQFFERALVTGAPGAEQRVDIFHVRVHFNPGLPD